MPIPFVDFLDNITSPYLGRFALADERIDEFRQFLLDNGFARNNNTANTITRRAREFYYGDTSQNVARPYRTPVNQFAALKIREFLGNYPVILGQNGFQQYIELAEANKLSPRLQSNGEEPESIEFWLNGQDLSGLGAIIISNGNEGAMWVAEESE